MNPVVLFAFNFTLTYAKPDTSLQPIKYEVAKLERFLSPPPEFLNSDTCFRYSQLLIVEIGKAGKVTGYTLNDFAPAWLKKDFESHKQNGNISFKRLDSVVLRSGIKNCKLVFPLTLESDNFPCAKIEARRYVETGFYKINGRSLSGNIIFMEPLVFTLPSGL